MIESYFNRLSNHTLIDSIEWELYFLALLWHFSSTFRAIGIWKDGSDAPCDLSIWANWRSPQLRSFMEVCKKPTPTARNFAPIRGENSQRWSSSSSLSVLSVLSVLSILSAATLVELIFVSLSLMSVKPAHNRIVHRVGLWFSILCGAMTGDDDQKWGVNKAECIGRRPSVPRSGFV